MNLRRVFLAVLPALLLAACSVVRVGQQSASVVSSGSYTYSPKTGEIPYGQYSGITYMGGTRYAVVHDKLKGGGIVFFDIVLSESGKILSVAYTAPSGTLTSKEQGLDNEGVAFVPSDTPDSGTLFVSSESRQSIVEYNLSGIPTGRYLHIPADMATDKIKPNNGFEALSYNAVTELFWTTTETPLKADGEDSRLLRIQSFGKNLKPAARFLYEMDAPEVAKEKALSTANYVHGVPALAALDNGRLLVLEREVFVPEGGGLVKALNSFSKLKVYLVNPPQYLSERRGLSSEPLEKQLVVSFSTNAFNLANYEGMCIGPVLPDGSKTLLLIADSQDGANGRLPEYIKVVVFK